MLFADGAVMVLDTRGGTVHRFSPDVLRASKMLFSCFPPSRTGRFAPLAGREYEEVRRRDVEPREDGPARSLGSLRRLRLLQFKSPGTAFFAVRPLASLAD